MFYVQFLDESATGLISLASRTSIPGVITTLEMRFAQPHRYLDGQGLLYHCPEKHPDNRQGAPAAGCPIQSIQTSVKGPVPWALSSSRSFTPSSSTTLICDFDAIADCSCPRTTNP